MKRGGNSVSTNRELERVRRRKMTIAVVVVAVVVVGGDNDRLVRRVQTCLLHLTG